MPPINISNRVKCFNLFQKVNHNVKNSLIAVNGQIKENFHLLPADSKICLKCKTEFYACLRDPNKKKYTIQNFNEKKLNHCDNSYHKDGVTTLEQIKAKFESSNDKKEKILLL